MTDTLAAARLAGLFHKVLQLHRLGVSQTRTLLGTVCIEEIRGITVDTNQLFLDKSPVFHTCVPHTWDAEFTNHVMWYTHTARTACIPQRVSQPSAISWHNRQLWVQTNTDKTLDKTSRSTTWASLAPAAQDTKLLILRGDFLLSTENKNSWL